MATDLPDICAVQECLKPEDATNLLQQGWVLLAVATGQDENGQPMLRYAVGRPRFDKKEFNKQMLESVLGHPVDD